MQVIAMERLSTKDVCDQGHEVARYGHVGSQGTGGMAGQCVSHEAWLPKGKSLRGAAEEVGVSVGCVRDYILRGLLQPDRVEIPGGFAYRFLQRDIDRLRETVAYNLQWMAEHRPGLMRYFAAKALEQGRRLPQSTGGRS